jgi:antitoxin component of MazEF toxin-antitoxin module
MALAHGKLQRVGEEVRVVLSEALLEEAGLGAGDEVLVHAEGGRITLTRIEPDLDRLMAEAERFIAAHPAALRALAT